MKKALLAVVLSLLGCTAQPVEKVQISAACDALYRSCCDVCRSLPPPVPAACWAGCMAAYAACLAEGG